jgi:hypothetical protein
LCSCKRKALRKWSLLEDKNEMEWGTYLVGGGRGSVARSNIQQSSLLNHAPSIIRILGAKHDTRLARRKLEQLRSLGSTRSITTSTAREQDHLITSSTTLIEVKTPIDQRANHERKARFVIMLASSDEVPFLAIAIGITSNRLDGDEVLAEVASGGVDRETLSA